MEGLHLPLYILTYRGQFLGVGVHLSMIHLATNPQVSSPYTPFVHPDSTSLAIEAMKSKGKFLSSREGFSTYFFFSHAEKLCWNGHGDPMKTYQHRSDVNIADSIFRSFDLPSNFEWTEARLQTVLQTNDQEQLPEELRWNGFWLLAQLLQGKTVRFREATCTETFTEPAIGYWEASFIVDPAISLTTS